MRRRWRWGLFLAGVLLLLLVWPRSEAPALPPRYAALEEALKAGDLGALLRLAEGEDYAAALAAWALSGVKGYPLEQRREALMRWRALVRPDPSPAWAKRLEALGRWDEAARVWRRCLPRSEAREALDRLAEKSAYALRYASPERVLELSTDPLLRARAWLRLGQARRALAELKGQSAPEAWRLKGEAHLALGEARQALRAFRATHDAWGEARALKALGDLEGAARAYARAGAKGAFEAGRLLEARSPRRALGYYLRAARGGVGAAAFRAHVLAKRLGDAAAAREAWVSLEGGYGLLLGKPLPPMRVDPLPDAPEGLDVVRALLKAGRPDWAYGEARVRFFAARGAERQAWGWVLFALGDPHTAARAGGRLAWSAPYVRGVRAAAQATGLDPWLLFAVMRVESAYDARALSPTGARGLFQFTPATWAEMSKRLGLKGASPEDPETAARAAAFYLRRLLDQFGDLRLAITAYNGGPGYVERGLLAHPVFEDFFVFQSRKEPRDYLAKVWAAYAVYRALGEEALRRPAFLEGFLPRP